MESPADEAEIKGHGRVTLTDAFVFQVRTHCHNFRFFLSIRETCFRLVRRFLSPPPLPAGFLTSKYFYHPFMRANCFESLLSRSSPATENS